MTLLSNLWTIIAVLWQLGWKAPKIFTVIARIRNVLGSEQFQKLIEAIGLATKDETETLVGPPITEPVRRQLLHRILRRFSFNQLGMTEGQYVAFCNQNGVAGPIGDEQLA